MPAILEVIAQVFVFTANRVADVVCFALLVASCAAPWRWPWFCTTEGSRMMEWEDGKWWGGALLNFFATLADVFTLPVFLM